MKMRLTWSHDLTPALHTTRLKTLAAGPKGGEGGGMRRRADVDEVDMVI